MLQSVQSPTHLSYTTLSQPFRIKYERYIFSKEVCSFVIVIDFVSACICIIVIQQYHTNLSGSLDTKDSGNVRLRTGAVVNQ